MNGEYIAIIVGVVSFGLKYFNINIGTADLTNVVTAVAGAISAIYLLVQRYKKGDITALGFVKK